MKKLLLCSTGMLVAFLSTSTFAGLLIYEPFDYTPVGTDVIGLTPAVPGTATWARAGTAGTAGVHQIASGSLTSPSGFPASVGNSGLMLNADLNEYARISLDQQYGTSSTLYYSLLLNVPSITGLTVPNTNPNANNDGIIMFNNSVGVGTKPNVWAGELVLRLGSVADTFNLGIRASSTAGGTTFFSSDLNTNQTYLVVVRYTSGATAGDGLGNNDLWIDPSSLSFGADEGSLLTVTGSTVGSMNTSAANDHVDSLMIGAGITAGADPDQTIIDEIRVGSTWADVTTIPEPATVGLIGLGALGLISWYRSRRR